MNALGNAKPTKSKLSRDYKIGDLGQSFNNKGTKLKLNVQPKLDSQGHLKLRESIALLHLLNKVPELPRENDITAYRDNTPTANSRSLSLLREKEIVQTLTFLASSTDDPGKVAALCIEEDPQHESLTLKIAANHGNLVSALQGIETIAEILQRVANQDRSLSTKESLLHAAASMNHNRILCRINSRHAKSETQFKKTKDKTMLVTRLTNLSSRISGPASSLLQPYIKSLQSLCHQLETMDSDIARSQGGLQLIITLIRTAHAMTCQSEWIQVQPTILSSASTADRKVFTAISKLGKYFSASRNIYEAACRYRIFTHISIEVVKLLGPPAIKLSEGKALNINNGPSKLMNRGSLIRILKTDISMVHQDDRIKHFLGEVIATKCAVHAEIQLLFHHEFSPHRSVPRVICSTKKACFLCNLYFRLHGRFYIPNTHGKLYEKWILPEIAFRQSDHTTMISETVQSFVDAIDSLIGQSVRAETATYPSLNESAEFHSVIWSVSSNSSSCLTSNAEGNGPIAKRELGANTQYVQNNVHAKLVDGGCSAIQYTTANHPFNRVLTPMSPSPSISSGRTAMTANIESTQTQFYFRLKLGQTFETRIFPGQNFQVETKRIHLTLTMEDENVPEVQNGDHYAGESHNGSGMMLVYLRYLNPEQQTDLLQKEENAVNLAGMPTGSEMKQTQFVTSLPKGILMYSGVDMIHLEYEKI